MDNDDLSLGPHGVKDDPIIRLAKLAVLSFAKQPIRGAMCGEKDAIRSGPECFKGKAGIGVRDDPQALFEQLWMAAEICQDSVACQFVSRRQRALDRLDDRHRALKFFQNQS
jgi:hypothetical protein